MAHGYPPGMTLRPLEAWPGKLTAARRKSQFSAPLSDTLALLSRELRLLEERERQPDTVLQMALREQDFRNDGLPRASAVPEHPGVILNIYPRNAGSAELSFPCDTFTDWRDNLRAITLTLEALRKINRYGVAETGQQYRGWRAIESGDASAMRTFTADDAAEVVFMFAGREHEGSSALEEMLRDPNTARRIIRAAKSQAHPDRNGGDRAAWNSLESALELLRATGVSGAE